jgi:D-lactate dehydrogenase
MTRLNQIVPVGKQMLCLAGAGIHDVAKEAAKINRESHSVLGSIFLNPSVAAGVAFGSGGTQIRKGPAYTERAIYAKINNAGEVEIVDTIFGLSNGSDDDLFARLESGQPIVPDDLAKENKPASDAERYSQHVCQLDDHVSRCNADTHGIEACRSEGKVLILATLHDTFATPKAKRTMWVGCQSLEQAHKLKQEVLLANAEDLPVSCEYMDRDSFDVIDEAGRLLCHAIAVLGIGEKLSKCWDLKLLVESVPLPFFDLLPDQFLFAVVSARS